MLKKYLCKKEISYIKYDGLFIQILPRPPIISDGSMAAVVMTTGSVASNGTTRQQAPWLAHIIT